MIRNVSIGNNSGTYSSAEACRTIGTGEPAFADSEIYVDGTGRVQYRGCHPSLAPGRFRWATQHQLSPEQKEQLKCLLS